MSGERIAVSRREMLAALGVSGSGALIGGSGTLAFFNDGERYRGNDVVAGEFDVKVDWEEHYSDWQGEETRYAEMVPEGTDPDDVDLYLPAGTNPDARPIALNFVDPSGEENGKDLFWDATSVEALPDDGSGGGTANDGIQDAVVSPCSGGNVVDVGPDDDGLSSDLRTNGEAHGQVTEPGDPLVNLTDVKPGDFGEVTFSFHLCTNPGYVWMNGSLDEAATSENGVNEAESKDPDEGEGVELLDELRTRLWYDDCDNQIARDGPVDVLIAVDVSISVTESEMDRLKDGLAAFVESLPGPDIDVRVGVITFGNNDVGLEQDLADPDSAAYTFDPQTDLPNRGRGNTPLPPALDIGDQVLDDQGRPDADHVLVVFTDGGPNYENQTYSANGYQAPRSEEYTLDPDDPGYDEGSQGTPAGGISPGEMEETAAVAETVRDSGTRIVTIAVVGDDGDPEVETREYLRDEIASSQPDFKDVAIDDLATVANDLVTVALEERLFYEGSLRETLAALSANDGRGLPLDGDRTTQFNEVGDDEDDPDRDCFAGDGTTHCVGLQWWLPVDHANQVQSDEVGFDLGFYAEQCRHNDGSTTTTGVDGT